MATRNTRMRGYRMRLKMEPSPEGRERHVTVWACKRGSMGHAPKELARRRAARKVAHESRRVNRGR